MASKRNQLNRQSESALRWRGGPRRRTVRRSRCALAAWLLPALLAPGCGYERVDGHTMGTTYSIQADCGLARPQVESVLAEVNRQMSTYDASSELVAFNRAPVGEPVRVAEQVVDVVAAARRYSTLTDGAFDATVAPLVALWGFGADASSVPPTAADIQAALGEVGHDRVRHERQPPRLEKLAPVALDLSALAKGHAVDELARTVRTAGCAAFLIEIGGEVRVAGASPGGGPWHVGVESPLGGHLAVLKVTEGAVATSGDYRQRPRFDAADGPRVGHVIDPRTGYPADHDTALVTVVAETAREADALATAFLVMGAAHGQAFATRHDIAALFATRDGTNLAITQSPAMAKYR